MAGVTIEKKTAEVNLSKLLAVNETLQKGAADLSQGWIAKREKANKNTQRP